MLSHTNGKNRTIRYRYHYNLLTDVEYPDYPANNVHYTYGDSTADNNGKGRIVMQEDGSGWQTFKYGKLGEVIENIRTFALPFENQPYTFKMQYEYDSWNRIQKMTYPDGEVVHYDYNLGGMLEKVYGQVKVSEPLIPVPYRDGEHGMDGVMRGGEVPGIIPMPRPDFPFPMVTYTYPYIDSIAYNEFELKRAVFYGNGTHTQYTYDSLQRLSNLSCRNPRGIEKLQDISYSYDSVSNITHIYNAAGGVGGLGGRYEGHYTYDNLYRLVAANGYWKNNRDSLPFSNEMSYTANGRITRKATNARILNGNHITTKSNDFCYSYAGGGNKVSFISDAEQKSVPLMTFRWDGCGNMLNTEISLDVMRQNYIRTHTWTEDNRLQTVADNSGFSCYQYDAAGDRTYKLTWSGSIQTVNGRRDVYYTPQSATLYVSPYLVATPQGYTKHYYAETERITSQLGRGKFDGISASVVNDSLVQAKLQAVTNKVRYPVTLTAPSASYFAYLDTLTNRQNATFEAYWYHTDHLGSSSWITYSDGSAVQHLHYLPFGEDFVNKKSSSFEGARYTFSAKEKDVETKYSYFGARYYSSELSIWLSVDPQSDKYPSFSPYVYCANNPIKLVDPNGEEIDDCIDKWKYNKTTGKLEWISNEGGKYHQIVVETENTSSGEKVNRTVEFDGAIGQMFDFSVFNKKLDGIINGAFDVYGGLATSIAGAAIISEGSVISGGAAFPVGAAIFSAGAYQTMDGLMDITNAIAGRGVDMYKQQDMVRDICKSAGNSVAGILSTSKNSANKDIVQSVGNSIISFGLSAYWTTKVRNAVTHPKMKSIPIDAIIH